MAKSWDQVSESVRKITDRLGTPVDPGIFDVVVALRLHGIRTDGSCEGHITHGEAAPWVDIGYPFTKSLYQKVRAGGLQRDELFANVPEVAAYRQKNLKLQAKLFTLLDAFYKNRSIPYENRLMVREFGVYGASRLQSQGVILQPLRTRDEQAHYLAVYQEEVHTFGVFLKHASVTVLQ